MRRAQPLPLTVRILDALKLGQFTLLELSKMLGRPNNVTLHWGCYTLKRRGLINHEGDRWGLL